MRTTYRVDFRRPDGKSDWVKETRFKTRAQAELSAEGWRARGYEARVVEEK